MSLSGVFTLPYHIAKSVVGPNGEMYYKITVREQIQTKLFKETTFYKFLLNDEKMNSKTKPSSTEKHLILFSAEEYVALNYPELSTYLT